MKKTMRTIIILVLICAVIAIIPLIFIKDSEFGGADAKAKDLISEIDSDYVQWTDSVIAPPGTETESLLFAIQAAIGAGIIGCGFGFLAARRKYTKKNEMSNIENDKVDIDDAQTVSKSEDTKPKC